ncbi:MAG: thiamine pyrophosphate-binding protein [Alphaproteobacteria bacterium]
MTKTNQGAVRPETPVPSAPQTGTWVSDGIADVLRALDIPFICLNPGASYRGLHDSIVNHLGNTRPQMLVCLHEEHAVAIAHGYAKVTGKPLAVGLHSNVGLMHGSMGIFNAWCDRAPMVVLGATGPVDAAKRRPWIDWIHTSTDQAALVRPFTKWDNQPASLPAAQEALLRAYQIAATMPKGPTYVVLDAGLQETRLAEAAPVPDAGRYAPPIAPPPAPESLDSAASLLRKAKRPVILAGRVSRSQDDWDRRVALAERLGAQVVTDLRVAASFPTDHPLHAAVVGVLPNPAAYEAVRQADVILSLDWIDLAGMLKASFEQKPITPKIVHASIDRYIHNGWSMDHQGLPPVDVDILALPDPLVAGLLERLGKAAAPKPVAKVAPAATPLPKAIDLGFLAQCVNEALGDKPTTFARFPLGWADTLRHFRAPLDYVGYDGGAGIGSGPGNTVGVALALKGSGRLTAAIIGDGDFLMSSSALWTAAHYKIPLLLIVANNRSYFNDELHQERVAKERQRPVENRWIGQQIRDPDVDLAGLARAQGCIGYGPVEGPGELTATLKRAIADAEHAPVLVDVRVQPGYQTVAPSPPINRM